MGRQGVQVSAAQQYAVGAQGDHPHHVEPVADAAVGENSDVAFHRVGNCRQGAGRGEHAIELAAAVVRDHNAVSAEAHRVAGVFRIEDPFDHHRAVPEVADPLQVFP